MSDTLRPVRAVDVIRVGASGTDRVEDFAAAEEPLDIRLHGDSFAIVMRTPGHDRELATGFLFSERVIRAADEIGAVEHCRHPDRREVHHVVDVFLRGAAADRARAMLDGRRRVAANSSCGVCGRASIDDLRQDLAPLTVEGAIDPALVLDLPDRLRATQATFGATGGLHGAALFSPNGTLVGAAEDVGRHNAVDKIVGRLLLDDVPVPAGAVLMVSGRVSFEIVQKAWLARIGILAAVSAPTSLAIELAREAGITLLGFVREPGFNIYTHELRVRSV